ERPIAPFEGPLAVNFAKRFLQLNWPLVEALAAHVVTEHEMSFAELAALIAPHPFRRKAAVATSNHRGYARPRGPGRREARAARWACLPRGLRYRNVGSGEG